MSKKTASVNKKKQIKKEICNKTKAKKKRVAKEQTATQQKNKRN